MTLKRLGKSKLAHEALGFILAAHVRFVRLTNRFEEPDIEKLADGKMPVIVAMWRGQHFMIPFARPRTMKSLAASRHDDAGARRSKTGSTALIGAPMPSSAPSIQAPA